MSGPTHKLYVDESGTKEYEASGKYQIHRGPTPYFVFAGLLIKASDAGLLAQKARAMKKGCFGTADVEIKANWLKRPDERRLRYLVPYGIDDARLDNLVRGLYGLLAGFDGELMASIVDKAAVQTKYPDLWYAPAIAYECLMQRAQLAMEEVGGRVSVTVDDMSGATPKGNQYKTNLFTHHRGLKAYGSRLIKMKMDRLESLGFSNSASDERLQLCDLAAYAVYRQFIEHGPAWDGPDARLPLYPYLGMIWKKFRRGPGNIVAGFGVVKFPRTSWKKWTAPNN